MSETAPNQVGGTDSDDNVVPPEQPVVPQEPDDGEPAEPVVPQEPEND